MNMRIPLPKQKEKTVDDKTKYDRPGQRQELKKIIQDVSKELKKGSFMESDIYKSAVKLASEKIKKTFDEKEYDTGGFDIMKKVVKNPKPVKKDDSSSN
jgi:hypothetical protein